MIDAPWWLDSTATFAGIAVGALMIVWQQRRSTSSEIKLKLFEELRAGLKHVSEAAGAAGMYAFNAQLNTRIYRDALKARQQILLPRQRFPEFMQLQSAAANSVADLMILLESHDIVSEHFGLFRQALGCAGSDANRIYMNMIPLVVNTWPVDLPQGTHVPASSDELVAAAENDCLEYWRVMNDVACYVYDIGVEAQNVLLDGIFTRRASARVPADPSLWVLRTNDKAYLKKVRRYFFEEHPAAAASRELGTSIALHAFGAASPVNRST